MQDLKNNNWIILDSLGNICEIHANLNVMTLLILNHFWITQAELRHICKTSFMFLVVTFIRRKNFINLFCPKYPKIINLNKKWYKIY